MLLGRIRRRVLGLVRRGQLDRELDEELQHHLERQIELNINSGMSPGVMLGLLAAFALTRLMRSLLFGISSSDPLTFGIITALVIVVALFACLFPARRATQIDPLVALRSE